MKKILFAFLLIASSVFAQIDPGVDRNYREFKPSIATSQSVTDAESRCLDLAGTKALTGPLNASQTLRLQASGTDVLNAISGTATFSGDIVSSKNSTMNVGSFLKGVYHVANGACAIATNHWWNGSADAKLDTAASSSILFTDGTVNPKFYWSPGGTVSPVANGPYTVWHSGNSAVQSNIFTGSTASTEGGTVSFAHGLDVSKIYGIYGTVEYATGGLVFPGHTTSPEYCFNITVSGANITVSNDATNSGGILSKPFRVVVFYIP